MPVDRLYYYKYSPYVSKDEPLPIVFYRTSGGDEPVRDWLLSLTADVRKEIGGDIRNAEIKLARRRQKEVTSS